MDNFILYKMLSNYYSILDNIGYVPINKVKQLVVLDFLTELVNHPDYYLYASDCHQNIANNLGCSIVNNNCLY